MYNCGMNSVCRRAATDSSSFLLSPHKQNCSRTFGCSSWKQVSPNNPSRKRNSHKVFFTDFPGQQRVPKQPSLHVLKRRAESKVPISGLMKKEADISCPIVTQGNGLVTMYESISDLRNWLQERLPENILDVWGALEGSKSLKNLWIEIVDGESWLEDSSPPKRVVNVACVRILNGHGQELIESRQEMEKGSFRTRNRPLSEKIKGGESVREACLRGIQEELGEYGTPGNVTLFPHTYYKEKAEHSSGSYPGLPTAYVFHKITAQVTGLPRDDFCTDECESHVPCAKGSEIHGLEEEDGQDELEAVGVRKHFWVWRNL